MTRPFSPARSVAMRKRWADPEQKQALRSAMSASVSDRMANDPVFAEKRRAISRANGHKATARLNTPAGSLQRKQAGITLTNTRLAWCPPTFRDDYRALRIKHRLTAVETRSAILAEVAHKIEQYQKGTLPLGEFYKVRAAITYLAERNAS